MLHTTSTFHSQSSARPTLELVKNSRNVADLPRSGRPRVTMHRQDHLLTNLALTGLRQRTQIATQLQKNLQQATGVLVSTQTVRNHLHDKTFPPSAFPALTIFRCQSDAALCTDWRFQATLTEYTPTDMSITNNTLFASFARI